MGRDAPIKTGAAFGMASSRTGNWGFERAGSKTPQRRLTSASVTVRTSSGAGPSSRYPPISPQS